MIYVKNTVFWDIPLGSLVVTRNPICKLNQLHGMHTTDNFCNLHNAVQPFQSCHPTQRLQVLNYFLGRENVLHSIIHDLWNTCRNHLQVHSYHNGLYCYHNPGIMLSTIYSSGQESREFSKF